MAMNAADFHIHAAIWFTRPACDTCAAIEIRYECDSFSFFKARSVIKINQLASQLVSQNSRVFEKWLRAFKCVQISAADTDSFDFYNSLPFFQLRQGG